MEWLILAVVLFAFLAVFFVLFTLVAKAVIEGVLAIWFTFKVLRWRRR